MHRYGKDPAGDEGDGLGSGGDEDTYEAYTAMDRSLKGTSASATR